MKEPFDGIININKPVGITSFDVVSKLRRLFKIKRIGHCGTLDPFAQGVLPVCIGKATSAVRYMDGYDKKYVVKIIFGQKTDTQDRTGNVIFSNHPDLETLGELKSSGYKKLLDEIQIIQSSETQMPPMYSAIKINGKPLYKYAREGVEVERKPRKIKIYSIDVKDIEIDTEFSAFLDVYCSKGTYIRTICDDLGDALGYGAYADSLIRTQCGPFNIENSISLEDLEILLNELQDNEDIINKSTAFCKTETAVDHFQKIILTYEDSLKLIQGQTVEIHKADFKTAPISVFDNDGKWIGIAKLVILSDENTENISIPKDKSTDIEVVIEKNIIKAERIFVDVQNYRKL